MKKLLCLLLVLGFAVASHASLVIGIHPADSRVAMDPLLDVAGASTDARVGYWNNYSTTNTTLTGDTLEYSTGATIGASFQVVATSSRGFSATDTDPRSNNDRRLYLGRPDMRGGESISWEVTGIPFGQYDLYVYGRGTASDRGGSISVTGQPTYYVRAGLAANEDGTGYTQITTTSYDPGNPSLVTAGNYAYYSGLTASSITITVSTLNMGSEATQRMQSSGFQLVQIPEPAALGLMGLAAVILLKFRRPSH